MPLNFYKKALKEKTARFIYRSLSSSITPSLCFSSNDYLGLSTHPALKTAWKEGATLYQTGATGSRLLSGNHPFINAFEAKIAADKKQEAALVFNSGFQANLTILSTLLNKQILGQEPLVFADRLNHASMHAGCQLAGVRQQRYQHLDLNHLESLLKKYHASSNPKFILTESIFGMEGDQADLEALATLAEKYQAFLYVDEAHATGVIGKRGYGLTPDTQGHIHAVMGTFSKALGLSGAYFASNNLVIDYLINFAPGFIYSTAPPFPLLYAASKAWALVEEMEKERQTLWRLRDLLHQMLLREEEKVIPSTTHIFGILGESISQTLEAATYLKSQGINVSAIRPPSVPQGLSRLRIALRAIHTRENIEQLIESLKKYRKASKKTF